MSTLKVNDIVDTGGHSLLGRRNLIINGAMQVAQRGTSATTSGYKTIDRWNMVNGTNTAFSVSQDSEAPSGFLSSLKFTVTTADSDITNQRFLITQHIEGQNTYYLNWGGSSAREVTLSFWVRSSLTGTFGGSIINGSENYSYPFSYSINTANTWEYKTVSISGAPAGTWATNNGIGISVNWSLGTGSYRLGTAGSWAASRYEGATGQVDLVKTNGATFYLTGVQLEVGSTATPFEHRSYGEELALCQRYYYRTEQAASGAFTYGSGPVQSTISSRISFPLPVSMRTTPSVSYGYIRIYTGNSAVAVTSFSGVQNNGTSVGCSVNVASGLTTGEGSVIIDNGGGTSYIAWDAEL